MSQIKITNLTFCYDGSYDNVFENMFLTMDTDWKLGLIGRNGKGKTTFLKLLLGEYSYQGKIVSHLPFQYFPFEVEDKSQMTLDIINSIHHDYEYWRLCKELSLLNVDEGILYQTFDTLSYGEQTKVLLAALFIKDNQFLLIDEPTNHLDMAGRHLVSNYLNKKKGFILVSHDAHFVDACVDHILSINRETIDIQKGTFSSWQQNKDYQDQFELGKNERLKKNIKRLEHAAGRTTSWSNQIEASKIGSAVMDRGYIGHKAAKMMKRAKSIEARRDKDLEEKKSLLKDFEVVDDLLIKPLDYHHECLVELNDLSIAYDGQRICKPVDFKVNRGERVALKGQNGCGKSSLIKLLVGEGINYNGSMLLGSQMKISYVPQSTNHLKGNLKEYAKNCGVDESIFKAMLKKLDFSELQFEKNMENFSEGQKKKVLIARSVSENAHLYIWDEPLNFIDVISRKQIENLIMQTDMTLILVEHDQLFLERVANKTIEIKKEKIKKLDE